MTFSPSELIKLGLIGDNINRSQSPRLHRTAGRLTGLQVTYDRLIPKDMHLTFDEVFQQAQHGGFRGINVTSPYEELVTSKAFVPDPLVRSIGAVNTVVFDAQGPKGFNTDYTGFMHTYRRLRRDQRPGTVCLIGTGCLGKAVAFGLVALEAKTIRCVDLDPARAEALAQALRGLETVIETSDDAISAAIGADGVEIFEQDFMAHDGIPREVGDLIRSMGLEITLFQPFRDFEGLPEPLRAKAFDRAKRKFDLMQELGTDLVLVCSSCHPQALDGIDRAAADSYDLGERAAKRDLRVSFEALAWGRHVNDHRDAWEIVRRADHKNVGLILSSGPIDFRNVACFTVRKTSGEHV